MAQTTPTPLPIPAHHLDHLILQDTKSCPAIKYPGRQHAQFAYLIEKRFKIRPPELRARMKRLGLWNPDPAALHQKHHHPHSPGPVSSRPNGQKLHLNIAGITSSVTPGTKPAPMEPRSPLTPVASPIHQFGPASSSSNSTTTAPITPICSAPPLSFSSSSMMTPPSATLSPTDPRPSDFRPTLPKLILSASNGATTIPPSPSASRPKLPQMMHHSASFNHTDTPTLRPIALPRTQYPQQLRQLRRLDTTTAPGQQPSTKRAKVKVTSAALRARYFPVEHTNKPLVTFRIRGSSEGGRRLREGRRSGQVGAAAPASLVIGREQMLRTQRGL
ncbi:hypothetical protein BJ508DRAFT_413384 [Ascobolus immersus RN42]|uniref:Uncharacterized protein n=1 Tax=Ascobolus immersus RN42 TaxID=1160509 RepID=A0A3N4ICA2_ASCIM|nr:hypothetical protein BJ508DRAFT_413384 [Ascobolus immersus RN42]